MAKALIDEWLEIGARAAQIRADESAFKPPPPALDDEVNAGKFAWDWIASKRLIGVGWHASDAEKTAAHFAYPLNLKPFLDWLAKVDPATVNLMAESALIAEISRAHALFNIKMVLCRLRSRGMI